MEQEQALKKFSYHSKNKEGRYVDGVIEAVDVDAALDQLASMELYVINIGEGELQGKASGEENVSLVDKVLSKPKAQKTFSKTVIFFAVGCLALLFLLLRFKWIGRPSGKPIAFEIVNMDDFTEDKGYYIHGYTVAVPRGISRADIQEAARIIYKQESVKFPLLQEAMFNFYYPDQDRAVEKPVAELRWNWNQSKDWEFAFHLQRAKGPAGVKNMAMEQVREVPGDFVQYRLMVPGGITIEGAEKVARDNINGVKVKWFSQVKRIQVDLVYEGFDGPFMRCVLKDVKSKYAYADCAIVPDNK